MVLLFILGIEDEEVETIDGHNELQRGSTGLKIPAIMTLRNIIVYLQTIVILITTVL